MLGLVLVLVMLCSVAGTLATATAVKQTPDSEINVKEIKENRALLLRDFSKGISLNEIEKIREGFVRKAKLEHPGKVISFGVPEIPRDAKIVAYAIKLDKDGVIRQY